MSRALIFSYHVLIVQASLTVSTKHNLEKRNYILKVTSLNSPPIHAFQPVNSQTEQEGLRDTPLEACGHGGGFQLSFEPNRFCLPPDVPGRPKTTSKRLGQSVGFRIAPEASPPDVQIMAVYGAKALELWRSMAPRLWSYGGLAH